MKKLILLILILSGLYMSSCDKYKDSTIYSFHPQACKYMLSIITSQYNEVADNADIKLNSMSISILTAQGNIDSIFTKYPERYDDASSKENCAKGYISGLKIIHDQAIEDNINKNKRYAEAFIMPPTKTNLITYSYRTTGITDFRIRTINTPLFGQPAGSELRDYFEIIYYCGTPYVIAYDTKNIQYNAVKKLPTEISQWLNLKPMAHPVMWIAPKSAPAELPVKVEFVVDLVTVDGKIISDTTKTINLIR